ncbi:hypothetical protein D3C81_1173280 [compost metagenome]
MVGCTFITELRHGRQGGVVGKVLLVGEHRAQHTAGSRVLDTAVIFAVEVGSREVHATVRRVGARADGGGIGHPHARCRAAGDQQRHGVLGGTLDHLRIGAGKTQAAQRGHVRTLLRGQYALLETHLHQRFHLRQALTRRFPRVGRLLAVALRSNVAVRQPAVVVRRSDQTIKIHFKRFHRQGSVDLLL